MKKIITIIISVVIILGSGGFWYLKDQEKKLEALLTSPDDRVETEKNTTPTKSNSASITASTVQNVQTKTFTLNDIAAHNKKSDCWMSVDGKVVDVTNFISMHPGGDKILKGCGIDASSYFNRVPSHLKGIAQKLLDKYKIGDLAI
jgi:cytochrome b involved in lipid metabolism